MKLKKTYLLLFLSVLFFQCASNEETALPESRKTSLPEYIYSGQEPNASWRMEAAARIEKYRKADLVVSVIDNHGRPVKDAEVKIEMQRHAFGFGSMVHAIGIALEGKDYRTFKSEDARRYRKVIKENYNKVVFGNDLKWAQWLKGEHDSGSVYARNNLLKALTWLQERNIPVRGHWIMHNVLDRLPVSSQELTNPDALRKQITGHILDEVSAMTGYLVEWDAINHLVGWGKRTHEVIGRESYIEFLTLIKSIDPEVKLYVNEGAILPGGSDNRRTRRNEYYDWIRYLLAKDAPLQGIGFMGHFNRASLTPPETLYRIYERYASFSLEMQVTELDINQVPDKLQASYLRDFMTVTFSHPAIVGIIMWGFWEGAHWKPAAALYRKDWSIKPAGEAWLDLVFKEWWTSIEGMSGADGIFTARGFLGKYRVTVSSAGRTRTVETELPAGGRQISVRMIKSES